jgi:serpin B
MQRRRLVFGAASLAGAYALAPLIAACGGGGKAEAREVRSDAARVVPDPTSEALADAVGSDIRAFGWDALQRLAAVEKGNLVISPYSIAVCMAMVRAGARGATASELTGALRLDDLAENADVAFNAIDAELRMPGGSSNGLQPFELAVANAVWSQSGFDFEQEFLDTLARYYGAGVQTVDFQSKPEPARQAINNWVSDETKKRIQDLLPKGSIDSSTRMVLANAIYFKADWARPFEAHATSQVPFNTLNGGEKPVAMMHSVGSFAYASVAGVEALELSYAGDAISMVVVLPAAGMYGAVEGNPGPTFEALASNLRPTQVSVSLPKWKFTSEFPLKELLEQMGARAVFDPEAADLSGIDGRRDLYVSGVFHKAFVSVDEKGTEAAAATGAVVDTTAAPAQPPVSFTVDRPFLFAIRHRQTGAFLFAGRVLDPTV